MKLEYRRFIIGFLKQMTKIFKVYKLLRMMMMMMMIYVFYLSDEVLDK